MTITVHYQSAVSYDIICTGMDCTMIQYNFLSECSVYCQNTSHLIPFQQSSQSLINAIYRVRFENGKSPTVVCQFLMD